VIGFQGADALKYTLTGKIRIKSEAFGSTTLPFESEGELSLKGMGVKQ